MFTRVPDLFLMGLSRFKMLHIYYVWKDILDFFIFCVGCIFYRIKMQLLTYYFYAKVLSKAFTEIKYVIILRIKAFFSSLFVKMTHFE